MRYVLARTDEDGSYEIDGLEPSTYHVWFRDCRSPRTHLSEWHQDAELRRDATPVIVVAGETTVVDAALDLGGEISGVVTDEETRDPIERIWVYMWGTDEFLFRAAVTDEDGVYRFTGLPGGEYKLFFHDLLYPVQHLAEFYDDEDTFADADPVRVSLGQERSGIDVALQPMLRPDLTLQGVEVEAAPVELGDVRGPDPGLLRDVVVTVRNIGAAAADTLAVEVEVCPETVGHCRRIVWDKVRDLPSGDTFTGTYQWNPLETGVFGDVTVRATAIEVDDLNFYNDVAETEHHVLVGGTGFGAGP